MYSSKSSNPFCTEDDDVDDSGYDFVDDGHGPSPSVSRNQSRGPDIDNRRNQLRTQIVQSENRQLESTQRALASIYDSERMGIATAEELVQQGEQLDNIESKTADMHKNLRASQKHLTSIKSVFGGIKNWWKGDKPDDGPVVPSTHSSALRDKVEKEREQSENYKGFYEDGEEEDELDSKFMAGSRKMAATRNGPAQQMITPVTRSDEEKQLNENLDLMSLGMANLKGLAMNLGDEIQVQNDQLDRINNKVDLTDNVLEHQNKQMRHILKK